MRVRIGIVRVLDVAGAALGANLVDTVERRLDAGCFDVRLALGICLPYDVGSLRRFPTAAYGSTLRLMRPPGQVDSDCLRAIDTPTSTSEIGSDPRSELRL